MDTIFTLNDDCDENEKINLDDLYERKKQYDLNTVAIYNRILNRIHTRVKNVSRQQATEQFCWFVIPEIIMGVPRYNNGECTAYVIDKLNENGFKTRYTHPNLLLISWKHWVPSYVRSEIKKKTGVVVDGYGNKVVKSNEDKSIEPSDPNALMFQKNDNIDVSSKEKDYKSIDTYQPTGRLIYNQDLLKRIEDKSRT
jgi:hypothetical protein